MHVIFSEIDAVLFPKMRGYEEIGERSFYERSVYFSIRMRHLMILTSLIILLVIGIGVAIVFIVENDKCKFFLYHFNLVCFLKELKTRKNSSEIY